MLIENITERLKFTCLQCLQNNQDLNCINLVTQTLVQSFCKGVLLYVLSPITQIFKSLQKWSLIAIGVFHASKLSLECSSSKYDANFPGVARLPGLTIFICHTSCLPCCFYGCQNDNGHVYNCNCEYWNHCQFLIWRNDNVIVLILTHVNSTC